MRRTMQTALRIVGSGRRCEDRAEILGVGDATIALLADGAGGCSGGACAAQMVIDLATARLPDIELGSAPALITLLHDINAHILVDADAGESTAIITVVRAGQIWGVSTGDSEAWMFTIDDSINLTRGQARSRRLGTAEVEPVVFGPIPFTGTLILGSDGLWKYANLARIGESAMQVSVDQAVDDMLDAARMRSGAHSDDVTVILVRG